MGWRRWRPRCCEPGESNSPAETEKAPQGLANPIPAPEGAPQRLPGECNSPAETEKAPQGFPIPAAEAASQVQPGGFQSLGPRRNVYPVNAIHRLKPRKPLRAWPTRSQRLRALLTFSQGFPIPGSGWPTRSQRLRALLRFSQGFPIPGSPSVFAPLLTVCYTLHTIPERGSFCDPIPCLVMPMVRPAAEGRAFCCNRRLLLWDESAVAGQQGRCPRGRRDAVDSSKPKTGAFRDN